MMMMSALSGSVWEGAGKVHRLRALNDHALMGSFLKIGKCRLSLRLDRGVKGL